jgi:hypothetical protein
MRTRLSLSLAEELALHSICVLLTPPPRWLFLIFRSCHVLLPAQMTWHQIISFIFEYTKDRGSVTLFRGAWDKKTNSEDL